MPRYKLTLAYDGTDYVGWQRQPTGMSIEQVLSASFMRTFEQQCRLLGASRTDAGVHAFGQVILCDVPFAVCPQQLKFAWGRALPPAVTIRSCSHDDQFHPHVNVKSKTYHYTIFTKQPSPFMARYGWYCYRPLDLAKLKEALNSFVGTYDFRAFCAEGMHQNGTVRTIDCIAVDEVESGSVYRVRVVGKQFMRHMIRRLVGAAVHCAIHPEVSVEAIRDVRDAKDPNHPLPKAPAHGLLLYSIEYREEKTK